MVQSGNNSKKRWLGAVIVITLVSAIALTGCASRTSQSSGGTSGTTPSAAPDVSKAADGQTPNASSTPQTSGTIPSAVPDNPKAADGQKQNPSGTPQASGTTSGTIPAAAPAEPEAAGGQAQNTDSPAPPPQESEKPNADVPASAPSVAGLVIPTSEVSEKAKFYPVEIDGVKLEVIAVKAQDGSIRTAFNTCQVCYDSGRGYYKQQGSFLVCQNCGNRFTMDQVEVTKGGCNPWPILSENKSVTKDAITIPYPFLEASKAIFDNWKTAY